MSNPLEKMVWITLKALVVTNMIEICVGMNCFEGCFCFYSSSRNKSLSISLWSFVVIVRRLKLIRRWGPWVRLWTRVGTLKWLAEKLFWDFQCSPALISRNFKKSFCKIYMRKEFDLVSFQECPSSKYMTQMQIQVSDGNNGKRCQMCSKLSIKTLERHHCCRSGVFLFSFEHISHLFVVLLTR